MFSWEANIPVVRALVSAIKTPIKCSKLSSVDIAGGNGYLSPQRDGEGKVVRERRWAPPSRKAGTEKSNSNTSLPQRPEKGMAPTFIVSWP